MRGITARRVSGSALTLALAIGLTLGCASGPSPLLKLREARATLDQARSQPAADAQAIADAEGALSYAEAEYKLAPRHPLSQVRAEKALEKARAALGINASTRSVRPSAH